ncbi:hypothetical protein ABPG75_012106 [Micractinium tetrahymenae]
MPSGIGTTDGQGLQAAAAATAAALGSEPVAASGRAALRCLFPGCRYLALGVCRVPPAAADASDSGELLLLLGGSVLSGAAGRAAPPPAPPTSVHSLRGSLAGAAILSGRPLTSVDTAAQAGGSGEGSGWSDTAQAAQQCDGAASFLCLPFRAAAAAEPEEVREGGASSSSSCGSSNRQAGGGVAAALLLGLVPPLPEQQQQQQQQQQQREDNGSPPLAQHLRALVQLAAALVRHAQHELLAAAEGLAVLQPAAQPPALSSDDEDAAESDDEGSGLEAVQEEEEVEEEEEEEEAEDDSSKGPPADGAAAAARAEGVAAAADASATARPAEAAAAAKAAAAQGPAAAAAAPQAAPRVTAGSNLLEPGSSRHRQAGPSQQAVDSDRAAAQGQQAGGAGEGPLPGAASLLPLRRQQQQQQQQQEQQQEQQQPSNGSGLAAEAEPGGRPGAAPPPRVPPRLLTLRPLCRATLAPLLQLLASRRDMQLDWLLRFREAGPPEYEPPSTLSPTSSGGSSAGYSTDASDHTLLAQQAQQAQQAFRGPEPLERQFLRYHSRLMADKMDAAGSLILFSILVLLSKEPSCRVRIGEPAFCAVAAALALPLAALLPGAPRAWYVRRREQLLQLFFLVVLIYQQAVHNFIDSHASRASQARYVNAGYAWITVDGVLLQMRFCRQLPTLLACFLLNLRAIPEVCALYHAHLDPRRCAAAGVFRGVLCLLIPLAVLYLLELRMRRNWLLRRHAEAARAEAEVQRTLRAQRLQERQEARRARAAGVGAAGARQ